jgi:thioredoxin-dependent peroxiredoxin
VVGRGGRLGLTESHGPESYSAVRAINVRRGWLDDDVAGGEDDAQVWPATHRRAASVRSAGVLEEGKPAPDFSLTADSGETITLSELRGQPVVLYFYPRDDTPGCTKQACAFRDLDAEFRARGATILGVSRDDVAAHRRFKEKYTLPFTLLADPDHAVADAYGVWGERSHRGKTYMGIQRSTFVIDADGRIAKAMYGVNAERNPAEVLEALPDQAGAPAR